MKIRKQKMDVLLSESSERKNAWKKSGCNSYSQDGKRGVSRPISLWTDENVEEYAESQCVTLSELYTEYSEKRTGCACCPYGAHLDGSRFGISELKHCLDHLGQRPMCSRDEILKKVEEIYDCAD